MSHSLFLVTLSHFFRPQAAQPSVAPHRQDSQITELIAQLLQAELRARVVGCGGRVGSK